MQHTYDDEGFFQAYAHMPRSRAGLAAAGEWGQLRPLFPQVAGKAVLDLGLAGIANTPYRWAQPLWWA